MVALGHGVDHAGLWLTAVAVDLVGGVLAWIAFVGMMRAVDDVVEVGTASA